MRLSGPRTQQSAVKCIVVIAETHGYKHQTRKQDPMALPGEKKFLPDLIATKHKGKQKRVFEVEATVNNQTMYKSIFSLLNALKSGATQGYLVVPDKKLEFARVCLTNVRTIIRHYSKTAMGAHPKVKIELLGFAEVGEHCTKAKKYESGRHIGQPPKCPFLPR